MTVRKRRISLFLTVVLLFVSVFSGNVAVKAGGGYDFVDNLVDGVNSDGTVTPGKTLSIDGQKLENSCSGFLTAYIKGAVEVYWDVDGEKRVPEFDSGVFKIKVRTEDAGKNYCFYVSGYYNEVNYNNNTKTYPVKKGSSSGASQASLDISIDKKGMATVTGKITSGSATFKYLWVDNSGRYEISGTTFTKKFDTTHYDVGYHELSVELSDGSEFYYPKVFPTGIYEKPTIKASNFETFAKKLSFTCPSYKGYNLDCYLQIKKAGEKWSKAKTYGPFSAGVPQSINKLNPGTKYTFRAFLAKKVKYSGKDYWITGAFSNEITVKTGPKAKPPIKSITTSKAVTSKHWVKPKYEGFKLVSEGFWVTDTTYTVTIKMKKKPGVAGIYVHSSSNSPLYRYLKGNKKVYKYKFTVGGKAIGKNATVQVYTKGNKTYGCYSPIYKKKVKIKR